MKGGVEMMRKLLLLAALIAAAAVIARSLPEVVRYLKIRNM